MTSQELIAAIMEAGYEVRSYSGRGMHGKQCVAVSINGQGAFWRLAYEMGRIHGTATFPDPVLDTLGEGYIVYWPEYAWPE